MAEEEVDNNPLVESENKDENPIGDTSKKENTTEEKKETFLSNIEIEKRKVRTMYIVLLIFLGVSLLFLILDEVAFEDDADENFDDHKVVSILIFIASIVVSVGLSSIVCIYDSLINNHFLGILFLLILNAVNDFSIIYAKHKIIGGFDEAFAVLITLIGGTLLIILAVQISKKDFQNSCNLYLFNGIGSIITGLIFYLIKNGFWVLVFFILAFIFSEFNIYFSQYKFIFFTSDKTKKEKKSDILIYSQPFELNISVFKCFLFVFSYIFKFFKVCCECCCSGKKEEK